MMSPSPPLSTGSGSCMRKPEFQRFWYWAVSSGKDAKGKLVGFNLGHGNGPEGTAENAVFYDGRLTKIGVVRCQAPVDDIMKPWKVFTDDQNLDLTFTPQKLQRNNVNIGALYANGWTTLGLFNGHLTLESGEVIPIKDLFGLYEWVDQKW